MGFFKSWRRKVGGATLVIALMIIALFARVAADPLTSLEDYVVMRQLLFSLIIPFTLASTYLLLWSPRACPSKINEAALNSDSHKCRAVS